MAKSAISIDVKAANSKLAQFLRRREEEEMILQIGKKKPKQLREEKLPGGRGRWMLEPDYRAPSPMIDRPRTIAGATSFHFSYISIAKQVVPTVNGQPVEGFFGKQKSAAVEHSKYIERDGAAEQRHDAPATSAGADHAAYVERPGAIETIDTSALMSEAVERQITAVINETPTDEEAAILGLVDNVPDGIPSVFSNISDDPFERQEFWRAVERIEATPRVHQLILDPAESPAWWNEVETTNALDPEFKNHALMVAEAYRQHMSKPVPEGERRRPFEAAPLSVSTERAGKLIQQAQRLPGYRDSSPPFEFKSGRGGRVQFRLVAELPYELTAEDRALIVQNFCDHIGGLEERVHPDGSKEKIGMMYTAVIHAPDLHNDDRNYHLHIVAYDRPARFLPELGQWDFEYAEVYQDPGSRKDRVRYPFRENKLGQIARVAKGESKQNAGIDFVPGLRRKFATITNSVLKARGIQRRLDPRKYSAMGIDRTPTQHLGTKAAALEAIGVPTTVGQLNAIAIWGDAERSIRRDAERATKLYRTSQDELVEIARDMTVADPQHPYRYEFRKLIAERDQIIQDVATDREAILAFDHMEAKAKSRALRTRQTCIQFLAEIEAGDADRNTRMMRSVIEDRWKGAQAHINQIDEALAPHRPALAAAARDIEKREARHAEIEVALRPIVTEMKGRLALPDAVKKLTRAKPESSKTVSAVEPTVAPMMEAPKDDRSQSGPTGSTAVAPIQYEAQAGTASQDDPASKPKQAPEKTDGPDVEAPPVESMPVLLEPASIEGRPIVEPTIAPRIEPIAEEVDITNTPEDLEPLRPEIKIDLPDVEPEVIVNDIDAALGKPENAMSDVDAKVDPAFNKNAPENAENGNEHQPSEPSTSAPEEKIDGRKKVVDPTLFDLPHQEAPIKPGTTKAEYADWDELIDRIATKRIPVKVEKMRNGDQKFTVPSLSPAENELLHARRFANRTTARLKSIQQQQQQEIQRLVRWIGSQGQSPDALVLKGKTASLSAKTRDAVRTLFHHWRTHENVLNAIRAENDRRIELAKAIAMQPVPAPVDNALEAKKAYAKKVYPPVSQARTVEVREYLELLHDAAPIEKLREAAKKIDASTAARDDVNQHSIELALAYKTHGSGIDFHEPGLAKDQDRGR